MSSSTDRADKEKRGKIRTPDRPAEASESRIVKNILKLIPSPEEREDYVALCTKMEELYRPSLPHQSDIVNCAIDVQWRLRQISAWEFSFFRDLRTFVNGESTAGLSERVTIILEIVLRHHGLEKIANYEERLRKREAKLGEKLRDIIIYNIQEKWENGSSHPSRKYVLDELNNVKHPTTEDPR